MIPRGGTTSDDQLGDDDSDSGVDSEQSDEVGAGPVPLAQMSLRAQRSSDSLGSAAVASGVAAPGASPGLSAHSISTPRPSGDSPQLGPATLRFPRSQTHAAAYVYSDTWLSIIRPIALLVPKSVDPTLITLYSLANHVVMLAFALGHRTLPGLWQLPALLLCAIINLCCIALDCIDGIHARRTNQETTHGAVISRWLLTAYVPMDVLGVLWALQADRLPTVLGATLAVLVQSSHAIVWHATGEQPRVHELTHSRFMCSTIYLTCALSQIIWPSGNPTVTTLVFIGSLFTAGNALKALMNVISQHPTHDVLRRLSYTFGLMLACAILAATPAISPVGYALLIPAIALRINGSYTMYASLGLPFSGTDRAVVIWLAILAWGEWVCEPIPLNFLFNKVRFMQSRLLSVLSVQDILPFVFAAHILRRAVKDLLANTGNMRAMDRLLVERFGPGALGGGSTPVAGGASPRLNGGGGGSAFGDKTGSRTPRLQPDGSTLGAADAKGPVSGGAPPQAGGRRVGGGVSPGRLRSEHGRELAG